VASVVSRDSSLNGPFVFRWVSMAVPANPEPTSRATEPDSEARDRLLVARIRQGDVAAFDALFMAYKNDLGAFVHSLVRSPEAAEEIIQDLFLRLWENRDLWDFGNAVRPYLFGAARNRAISHLRHERVELELKSRVARERHGSGHAVQPMADAVAEANDLEAIITRVVESLPPRCREVFQLSRRHQLSHAEVARVMGISVKTVEVQLRRALAALRAVLTDLR